MKTTDRLQSKVAMITGAARGLGRACALRFAQEGADLILLDIAANLTDVPYKLGTRSQLEHTADLCRRCGASVLTEQLDVRELPRTQNVVEWALSRYNSIDILVNSAGIAAPSGKIVHEIEESEWKLMLDIDLSGAWRMIKAVGSLMVSQRSGSIINISSTAGAVGYRHFAAYVAAKHGLIGLTRAAALDYAPFRVRVNALLPGSVRDDHQMEGAMLSEIARCLKVPSTEYEETFEQSQPTNSLIEPDDIAYTAVWLASDESRQVTGSVVTVDGGYTAR